MPFPNPSKGSASREEGRKEDLRYLNCLGLPESDQISTRNVVSKLASKGKVTFFSENMGSEQNVILSTLI